MGVVSEQGARGDWAGPVSGRGLRARRPQRLGADDGGRFPVDACEVAPFLEHHVVAGDAWKGRRKGAVWRISPTFSDFSITLLKD